MRSGVSYSTNGYDELTEFEVDAEIAKTRAAFRATLTAMRDFRREYNTWERLTAEYALGPMSYTQRDAAKALGIATSTVNRWAQHPLQIEDNR